MSTVVARFNDWRRRHMSDTAFFFLLTVIIGLIAGTAAHLLKMMIKGVSAVMTSGFTPAMSTGS